MLSLIPTALAVYCIMGKFGKFGGELSIIRQTKTIQNSTKINDLLADLLIRKTFFRQMLEESQFKSLPRQTFPLYGIRFLNQARTGCRPACTWFLKINPVRIVGLHACVCVRAWGY